MTASTIKKTETLKKKLIISFEKLSPELLKLFHDTFPTGCEESLKRIPKPNGEYFYAVQLESEDTSYLVKMPVKIDDGFSEEEEKDIFGGEELPGADDISADDDAEEEPGFKDEPVEEDEDE
jgi:hypothetical protein